MDYDYVLNEQDDICVVSESITLAQLPNLLGFRGLVWYPNEVNRAKNTMTKFKVCAEDFPQIILSLIFLKLNNCKGN